MNDVDDVVWSAVIDEVKDAVQDAVDVPIWSTVTNAVVPSATAAVSPVNAMVNDAVKALMS